MEVDQAPAIAHGHAGTPVEDLFPLGDSGSGSGSQGAPAQFGREKRGAIPQQETNQGTCFVQNPPRSGPIPKNQI